ncbi:hypothetical protein AGLY_017906 [Aphis glycines]|uniref:Uncharacterized protein n=1 Tax=Aphis glycines TaxID=307491 RepID=A0A6G0STJ2_APHGL|nr:hypothetical protein AGLY_017906 [Aphis glycines]
MLRLQTLRVIFDCKSNVLDATNLEGMLRLQTLRVVFDCKPNVLDATNLEFSKSFAKCLCNCYSCIVEFSKKISEIFFFVSLYNITCRKNAPITNFEVERMLRLQTLRVIFDCKSNVLDAYHRWFSTANRMSLMQLTVKSEHFPTVFIIIDINEKKKDRKRQILHKTGIRPNRYLNKI